MELNIFNYNDTAVRTVVVEGEPWFVLADLCKVLGLARGAAQISERLDDGVRQTYPIQDSLGRTQNATIVSEAGMYEVVIRSDKPEATTFRRWITSEVLPSIRKHGMYATDDTVEKLLGDPDAAIQILTRYKEERDRRRELEAQATTNRPKVIFADAVSASASSILIGELAKILRGNGVPIGQNRLFERLRQDGFLIRRRGSDWNMPTQRSMELGLFEIKETAITHSDGHVTISKTTKVTGKGQQYFIDLYLGEQDGAA